MGRVQFNTEGHSLTRQEFKKECDINEIMKRFKKLHGADYLNKVNSALGGTYGDFSAVPDYRTARDQVNRMEASFMALPAKVRSRFGNDPAQLLDFITNPKNLDEAVSLGLVNPKPKVEAKPEVSAVSSTGK